MIEGEIGLVRESRSASESKSSNPPDWGMEIRTSSRDESLKSIRIELVKFATETFSVVGQELHILGNLIGQDRHDGISQFGHGTDETVAISVLLRILDQLASAALDLFVDGRHYAAAALLRQIVEIEYLAWAFETRDGDAERWLRSDKNERQTFFRPAKLRNAAKGKFRGQDYGYHCELGGHPVPGGTVLLHDDPVIAQLLLADLLGHSGRIWDHIVGWATGNPHGGPILERRQPMLERFSAWKSSDPLAALPPPL